jgi:hypothetical protein
LRKAFTVGVQEQQFSAELYSAREQTGIFRQRHAQFARGECFMEARGERRLRQHGIKICRDILRRDRKPVDFRQQLQQIRMQVCLRRHGIAPKRQDIFSTV